MVKISDFNFPYEKVRSGQAQFMKSVYQTIEKQSSILVNAPTGLGKTICSLAPTLYLASKYNKKVIYLTSRQTQVNQKLCCFCFYSTYYYFLLLLMQLY